MSKTVKNLITKELVDKFKGIVVFWPRYKDAQAMIDLLKPAAVTKP